MFVKTCKCISSGTSPREGLHVLALSAGCLPWSWGMSRNLQQPAAFLGFSLEVSEFPSVCWCWMALSRWRRTSVHLREDSFVALQCCLEEEDLMLFLLLTDDVFINGWCFSTMALCSRLSLTLCRHCPPCGRRTWVGALFLDLCPSVSVSLTACCLFEVLLFQFALGVVFFNWNIFQCYFEKKGTGQLTFIATCHQPRSQLFLFGRLLHLSVFHFPLMVKALISFYPFIMT